MYASHVVALGVFFLKKDGLLVKRIENHFSIVEILIITVASKAFNIIICVLKRHGLCFGHSVYIRFLLIFTLQRISLTEIVEVFYKQYIDPRVLYFFAYVISSVSLIYKSL